MKKAYQLIATIALSVSVVGVFGQNLNLGVKPNFSKRHFQAKENINTRLNNDRVLGQAGVLLNYDSADATFWDPSYNHNFGELMNVHYQYPQDTVGGNYQMVNYFSVAFDSMYDPYAGVSYPKPKSIKIDTLVVPVAQINNSGINDTLDIQINSVDATGYPTATELADTMIIGTTNIGAGASNMINYIAWGVNRIFSVGQFAVTLKYYGAKVDSCSFIYGYGYFSGGCPSGSFDLALPSNWSTVNASTPFVANTFTYWPQFNSLEPNNNGGYIYFDCNGDGKYEPNVDGLEYYQNALIIAMVDLDPLGINEVASKNFSVGQNYPNPFNNTTDITYNLTKSANVTFGVYDMTGRELVHNSYTTVAPGMHVISLQANQFTPGIYFYTFNVNGVKVTRKMVITQ